MSHISTIVEAINEAVIENFAPEGTRVSVGGFDVLVTPDFTEVEKDGEYIELDGIVTFAEAKAEHNDAEMDYNSRPEVAYHAWTEKPVLTL